MVRKFHQLSRYPHGTRQCVAWRSVDFLDFVAAEKPSEGQVRAVAPIIIGKNKKLGTRKRECKANAV